MAEPPLLTYQGAADYLAVSPRTVRQLVHDGALPVVRVGGSVRIRRAALEAYVAERETRRVPAGRESRLPAASTTDLEGRVWTANVITAEALQEARERFKAALAGESAASGPKRGDRRAARDDHHPAR